MNALLALQNNYGAVSEYEIETPSFQRIGVQAGRSDLARFLATLGVKTGAEIGVERGVYSKELLFKNKGLKLYCVDPWLAYKGYREHVSQWKLDDFFQETAARLSGYNVELMRMKSVDAAESIEDDSLDFVYIDANHSYEHVTEDLEAWFNKVRSGGIISGHDYVRHKGQGDIYGVVDAVNDFVTKYGLTPLIIWRGDRSPSWMFVKP